MQLPIVLALILCDDVWTDRNSRKLSVLGVYGSLMVARSNPRVERLTVYTSLTECPARFDVKVRVIDVNDERTAVAERMEAVESPDPRAVLQGFFRFDGVNFDHPGEYRVQLWACDELLLERRLLVAHI